MITYNPKAWFSFIFRFHKADTLRQLFPTILGIMAYVFVVIYIENHYFKVTKESAVNYINVLHGILGFVISLLLVFRTNTGYDRWWEGRRLWGQLTNCSRNAAVKINMLIIDKDERNLLLELLTAFPFALRNHLQGRMSVPEEWSPSWAEQITNVPHKPLAITSLLYDKSCQILKRQANPDADWLILNAELQQLMEICGACERIKNTPIPFSYSVFIKKFIFFYVMTLPFSMASTLRYFSMPVVAFIFYVLASLELIAEEIENPFGTDSNDLPLREMCLNIKKGIEQCSKNPEAGF